MEEQVQIFDLMFFFSIKQSQFKALEHKILFHKKIQLNWRQIGEKSLNFSEFSIKNW